MPTYANKNYDPQKAHEYYEAHKKKTARTSTKGFNESQKAMASYVKSELQAEKKQKNKEVTEKYNASAKAQREMFSNQCKEKVKAIRERLKGMSKEEKKKVKETLNAEIKSIRASFSAIKKDVTSEHSKAKKFEKDVNQKEYQDKYQQAISEIRSGK